MTPVLGIPVTARAPAIASESQAQGWEREEGAKRSPSLPSLGAAAWQPACIPFAGSESYLAAKAIEK